MKPTTCFLPLAALGLSAIGANAATIVYGFETNNPTGGANITHAVSSNDFGSGITASDWSATAGNGTNRPVFIDGQQMRAEKGSATDTHTFTVTIPNLGGNTVNLTNLSFDYGEEGPDNGAPTWTISSDLSGGTITPNTANGDGSTNSWSGSASLALAGNFTGLNDTTITFTLQDAAGGNNNQSSMYTWIDNVTLTGTVVPEPATAALLGLGGLALLRRRPK